MLNLHPRIGSEAELIVHRFIKLADVELFEEEEEEKKSN